MRKIFASVALAAALVLGGAAAASAYTPVPSGGTSTTIPAGGSATFLFSEFTTGTVTYTLTGEGITASNLAASASVSKAAGQTVTVTLPSAATGSYSLVATDGAVTSTVAITASTSASASPSLASTGADNMGLVAGAGALLVVGAGAVIVAARRRSSVDA